MPQRRLLPSFAAALALLVAAAGAAMADKAKVLAVEATANGDGTYTFAATVRHADTGWKHYADKFEVLAPDGTVLGTRVLHHPHVDEQPFTRSLGRVAVPKGVTRVTVRAWDNVHGAGEQTFTIDLASRR